MAEEEKNLPEEEPREKTAWQEKKEGWYDKVPLTLKQLDLIINVCLIALAVTFVLIFLDALDIFHLFG